VRGNLQTLADVTRWRQVVAAPLAPVIEDAAFLSEAADKLPAAPWDDRLALTA
jgi:glutamyl-tRNA synthetase